MNGDPRNDFLDSRAFASAVLLEKIVRDAYENRHSSEVQPLQWSIMRYLGSQNEARCTIGWISSFLGLTHAPVVRAVKTLQKRNYVTQKVNPSDGRGKIFLLTAEGWNQLKADPLLVIARRIDKMNSEGRSALMDAVKHLISHSDTGSEKHDAFYPSG